MRQSLRHLMMGLLACAFALALGGRASAMSFALSDLNDAGCAPNCPKVITATGEIELSSDEAFFRFVSTEAVRQKVTSVVLMSSPGGNLVGSLRLGIMMRQLGFSIMVGQVRGGQFVTARCYSACAYTLAGGKRRIVPDGSSVGVHRAWTARTGQRDILGSGSIDAQVATEGFSPVLERYLRLMGVSGQLVALADSTPSSQIRVLTRSELSRLRVITPEARQRRSRS